MKTLQELKKEQMKNPEFVKEYDAIQPEMDVIRAIVDARTRRILHKRNLQKEQVLIRRISVNSKMVPGILQLIYLKDWLREWEWCLK